MITKSTNITSICYLILHRLFRDTLRFLYSSYMTPCTVFQGATMKKRYSWFDVLENEFTASTLLNTFKLSIQYQAQFEKKHFRKMRLK